MSTLRTPSRIVAYAVSGVLCLFVGIGAWNGLRPLPVVAASIGKLPSSQGTASLAWPTAGEAAIGAIGYGLLATAGPQQPLPTASVTKVIVSLAVLEKLPLKSGEPGPLFTVSEADVASYHNYLARDGSVLPVTVGEQLNEYQALQALMLPSANNIADSLAGWVFGSLDNYFAYGNAMVKRLGMTHTMLAGDASGLSPLTVSTSEDLVKLGEAAMAQPVLAQIVAQKTTDLPIAGGVFNYNGVLGEHGIVGIKTGNSDEAGGCFLFAATYDVGGKPVTVIGAIMGVANLLAALNGSLPLLDTARSNFSLSTPVHKGDTVATYTLPWGKTAKAVAKSDVSLVTWRGTAITSTAEAQPIHGSQKDETEVGKVRITAGDQHAEVPLVLAEAVDNPSIWWRVSRH